MVIGYVAVCGYVGYVGTCGAAAVERCDTRLGGVWGGWCEIMDFASVS